MCEGDRVLASLNAIVELAREVKDIELRLRIQIAAFTAITLVGEKHGEREENNKGSLGNA